MVEFLKDVEDYARLESWIIANITACSVGILLVQSFALYGVRLDGGVRV